MSGKMKIFHAVFGALVFAFGLSFCCGCKDGKESGNNQHEWPKPPANCPHFTQDYTLPQTQSAGQLATFMETEHLDYSLDGWFFFGSLEDSAAPDDLEVFFIAVQRIDMLGEAFGAQQVPAVVAFNNKSLGKYEFGGFYELDVDPFMVVKSDPWSVELFSPFQEEPLITMETVSGRMGEAGAVYLLKADITPDFQGFRFRAEIRLRDRYGAINQGYGSASFFPQFLTPEQRALITKFFGGSVQAYLESTGDPMACQGSFYYTLPLLDVEQFTIMRGDTLLSSGAGGLMWLDYIVQTYDQQAMDVVVKDGSWQFFAIQLPEENAAIMVLQVNGLYGSLPVATLFRYDSDRTRNLARKPAHSWGIDEIKIEPNPNNIWVSPDTGLSYHMQYRIRLGSGDHSADLFIKMAHPNQEVVIDPQKIKYEGLGAVEGMLEGFPVTGQVFLEVQPAGKF